MTIDFEKWRAAIHEASNPTSLVGVVRLRPAELSELLDAVEKWVHAEASATSANIALNAELVDARQVIERLRAELRRERDEVDALSRRLGILRDEK